MEQEMVAQLTCPHCNSSLEVSSLKTVRIRYRYDKTTRDEIKEGTLICKSCGNKFVIKHFIPSFLQSELVDNELLGEGTFWGQYYSFLNSKGITNFMDIQNPFAPLYRFGILEKVSPKEREQIQKLKLQDVRILQNDESSRLIYNRVINGHLGKGSNVLEVGCGSGWLSLELKRKGFDVVGLDPSFSCLKMAKNYAISKGIHIEYIHADAALSIFKTGIFDAVFAFHSLHHVKDFDKVVKNIRLWLRQEGIIAIYEHRRALSSLNLIKRLIYLFFFPVLSARYNHDKQVLSFFLSLQRGKSPAEDTAVHQIDRLAENFAVVERDLFFHLLDEIPCLTYYALGRNLKALEKTACVIDLLQGRLKIAFPDKAEFVLCIGFNRLAD
jgi:2-polyprenyl-3-methyl-5-hydroxy-6-metoxy-1,4-benzoquinol methylase/uncharacterized protein YbaR (Trm112 family)